MRWGDVGCSGKEWTSLSRSKREGCSWFAGGIEARRTHRVRAEMPENP
jgi:hypothetical protein